MAIISLGEQLRNNIAEENFRKKKALERKLEAYTNEITKWIQDGKTIPRIWLKDQPDLFEDECIEFLKQWADGNGMQLNLWNKSYSSMCYFEIEPKEL